MTFNADQKYLVLDYECYSEASLKETGAVEYSKHHSTEIICAAWRLGTRESLPDADTKLWIPFHDEYGHGDPFTGLFRAFLDPSIIIVAHNAFFERCVTRNTFAEKYMYSKAKELKAIPISRYLCTASLAAALALPRSLEGASNALGLKVQKDMEGRRLLLKMCKPRKPSKKNPSTRHNDPADIARLGQYCITDVDTEVELFLRANPLIPKERRIWMLDQAINERGFEVDIPVVNSILKMIDIESKEADDRVMEITGGTITSATKRNQVLTWLQNEGVFLPDLTKGTVADAIQNKLADGDALEMLKLRQTVGKTSVAKYPMYKSRTGDDNRLRDILLYHGAAPGRWSGVGIQPQNFPRGSLKRKEINFALELIQENLGKPRRTLKELRFYFGEAMPVFSSLLRPMIKAPTGKTLDIADYNAIEARVLFWVAKHADGLRAFREGKDLYVEQAAAVFNMAESEITKDSLERFVGKGLILGCGYQLGAEKFVQSCMQQGREITLELADTAVKAYRKKHRPVVNLWYNLEQAAKLAVKNPGKAYTVNRTKWFVRGEFLYCQLPSGRRLAYYRPTIGVKTMKWGEKKSCLYYYSVNSMTHRFEHTPTYGGHLTENVCQAIARDIMAEAMLRIDEAGWEIVLTVHDELIAERALTSKNTNRRFCNLMAELPDWAEGLPLSVEGFESERYLK